MPESYPIPSYAANIWTNGVSLFIGLPNEAGRGHTVEIPLTRCEAGDGPTQRGWGALLNILIERSREGVASIGTRAAPVQYDIEAILRAVRSTAGEAAAKRQEEKEEAALFLEELGL